MIPVVLALCSRDQSQALSLLDWIGELGMNQSKLFILCSKDCRVDELMEKGRKGFAEVVYMEDVELVNSNWHEEGHHVKSAAGPNSLFRQAAWRFYLQEKTPWLFLEPDAIPCYPGWLRDISDEYELCIRSGKHFLGFEVKRDTHPGDVGHHMSGIGVYPFDVPQKAHTAISSGDTAFDIEGASKITPQMMGSKIIMHRYRPPSFTTQEDFEERIPKHLAIYHACKDGSIYPFLRNRLGIVRVGQSEVHLPSKQIATGSSPVSHSFSDVLGDFRVKGIAPITAQPICDIVIKTRPHDYDWLEWCLKSIGTNCFEFNGLILINDIPSIEHPELFIPLRNKHIGVPLKEPGYLWQQRCKLYADQYSDAEYILFQDSDTIFTRPVTPSNFIKDGKPVWLYSPLDKARPDQHAWIPVMEKFLGKKPEHEFMRRHPFIVPRWAFEELRTFCKYKHGMSLEDYIMAQAIPGHPLALVFSEWNCMGFFLWEYHHDKVCWMTPEEAGPACVYQGFTHAGEDRKQEDIDKFKELLGSTPSVVEHSAEEVHLPPPQLTEDSAIEFLANGVKDNFHKARIVKKLKKAWEGKGEAPKKKKAVSIASGILLCIHGYPGANEAVQRHWPYFEQSGATRIVGIGTLGGGCEFPCESVEIGENAYMKIRGSDDHLCRRLLDTVKWCLKQPEDKFAIIEYDTLPLSRMPEWKGISACLTGGRVNGSIATQFFHNPWLFDRASGETLVRALEKVLPESASYPNNSPDLFFGLACERANITVGCNFRLFTRNRLDDPEDLALACKMAREGVHFIHGVKTEAQFNAITEALNDKGILVSH
jgi:hypothetical protein